MVDSLKTAAGENVMLQVPSGPELPQLVVGSIRLHRPAAAEGGAARGEVDKRTAAAGALRCLGSTRFSGAFVACKSRG